MSDQTDNDPEATGPAADERDPAYLGNIAFWVSDYDAMRAFYTDVLGVPERAAGDRPHKWAFYGDGGFSFSLNQAEFTPRERGWTTCPKAGSTGDNRDPYITFYVPDLGAILARCRVAGIAIRNEDAFSLGEGFGISVEVMDPDGNAVALTQR